VFSKPAAASNRLLIDTSCSLVVPVAALSLSLSLSLPFSPLSFSPLLLLSQMRRWRTLSRVREMQLGQLSAPW